MFPKYKTPIPLGVPVFVPVLGIVIFPPTSKSSAILTSLKEAVAEPLKLPVISSVPVILNVEPSNVKFADESTP